MTSWLQDKRAAFGQKRRTESTDGWHHQCRKSPVSAAARYHGHRMRLTSPVEPGQPHLHSRQHEGYLTAHAGWRFRSGGLLENQIAMMAGGWQTSDSSLTTRRCRSFDKTDRMKIGTIRASSTVIEAGFLHDRCDECMLEDVRKLSRFQRTIKEFDEEGCDQIDDLFQNVRRGRVSSRWLVWQSSNGSDDVVSRQLRENCKRYTRTHTAKCRWWCIFSVGPHFFNLVNEKTVECLDVDVTKLHLPVTLTVWTQKNVTY